jgi:hypothetical protein
MPRAGIKRRDAANMLRRLYARVNASASHELFLLLASTFLRLLSR